MPPKPRKKVKKRVKQTQSPGQRLAIALAKCKKAELIDLIVDLAEDDSNVMRWLESEVDVKMPANDLAESTRLAISDATDFDERQINRNFDYDYGAYEAIERNFKKLIDAGNLSVAMDLSLELMKEGSYQVEMSDEGLMSYDIEKCLNVVIKALMKKGSHPPSKVIEWCERMVEKDRIGCHCDGELTRLRKRSES